MSVSDARKNAEETAAAETDQPGLDSLREAVRKRQWTGLPRRAALHRDAMAGLSSAISNVPDGMANGALLGVSPVHGLYGTMFGPAVGGALSSTQLMMITTMAAASLSASQALGGLEGQARLDALFAMVILIGVFQVAAGLLRLGRLLRFVSYSVTTGFLIGVSVLLILNQLPDVSGRDAPGGVGGAIRLLLELDTIHLPSLALAMLTAALAILLPRTKVGQFGRLVAVLAPSLFRLEGVTLVRDSGKIPQGLPLPSLPPLSAFGISVITGAAAVTVIILVQPAGVSASVPNPDGSHGNRSRDFAAIGAANVASGLFRGLPVGGSLSGTALNLLYGGQTRWASIFAGLFMALIVVLFSGAVGIIAMPALGALLILAGISSIKPRDIRLTARTGWPSWLAGGTTFVAMLFLPIQAAVGFGVVLSAFLYITRSSTDLSLVELIRHAGGEIEERLPPRTLPSEKVTVLDVYGQLFYAGAQTLERLLPRIGTAERPVVVLRLRGLSTTGATLLDVLSSYAGQLEARGGRLYLTGVNPVVRRQIIRTRRLDLEGPVRIAEATAFRGESTQTAVEESREWLVRVAKRKARAMAEDASRRHLGRVLKKDVPAGLVNAVVSVPDGLASAALAGVSPVYGLYTSIAGPIAGSLLVSSQLMQISTTTASALAAGQAIAAHPEGQRGEAMFLLVLLIGAMMTICGILRLGRLSRYVSHSVPAGSSSFCPTPRAPIGPWSSSACAAARVSAPR